jgi:Plasmid encoded RepA protein
MTLPNDQLELIGITEARRLAETAPTKSVRSRILKRIETEYDLRTALPSAEDLAFNHSGLCQTCLPHSRPTKNSMIWKRQSGRFTLMVTPGAIGRSRPDRKADDEDFDYVGVPYGPKSRLIMIHLQTEGLKSRTVSLGRNLSAFLRSLGLPRTGGPRGSIIQVREQCMRIARCTFTLQWTDVTEAGAERTIISDTKIVEGLELWNASSDDWSGTVELSDKFHEHLCKHAVPLDKRGLALLSGNSLGLDLYALFAYRLPRLSRDLHLPWSHLQEQIGSEYSENKLLARKVREVLVQVKRAYPHGNFEVGRWGIIMKPSPPAVPKDYVQGFRMIEMTPASKPKSA